MRLMRQSSASEASRRDFGLGAQLAATTRPASGATSAAGCSAAWSSATSESEHPAGALTGH
eukprot:15252142-Alexandrium_andersonii.AAC.1